MVRVLKVINGSILYLDYFGFKERPDGEGTERLRPVLCRYGLHCVSRNDPMVRVLKVLVLAGLVQHVDVSRNDPMVRVLKVA